MKTTLSTLLLSAALCSADLVGGIGYINLSDDVDNVGDLNLGLIYGSVGFDFSSRGSDWALIPEVRFGTGFDDETIDSVPIFGGTLSDAAEDVDFSVDSYLSFLLNIRYSWSWGYLQGNVNYTSTEAEATSANGSATDSDGEFGVGLALGLDLTRTFTAEAHIESFDSVITTGVGLRYKF